MEVGKKQLGANVKQVAQNPFVVAISGYAKYLSDNYSNETLVVSLYSSLTSILESHFPTRGDSCTYAEQLLWWIHFGVFAVLLPMVLSTVYILNEDDDDEENNAENRSNRSRSNSNLSIHSNGSQNIAGVNHTDDPELMDNKSDDDEDLGTCATFWVYCCLISCCCIGTCGLISCCIVYDQWMRFAIVILMCILRTFRPFNCYVDTDNPYITVGVTAFVTLLLMLVVFIDVIKSNNKKKGYKQPLLSKEDKQPLLSGDNADDNA